MRVKALMFRILHQLRRDKRTLALMLLAPLLVLTLTYFVFGDYISISNVALINAPTEYVEKLDDYNIKPIRCSAGEAQAALERGDIIASVNIVSEKAYIQIDGSNSTKAGYVLAAIEAARNSGISPRPDLKSEVNYVYGYEDLSSFDNFGSMLIGFIIFFFVFLVAGISFLQERTTGTLEKLLSTPIKRWEIVIGYVLGFGFFTMIQATLISFYCVYVLKVMMTGSFGLVLLIALLTAISALTLGILLSTAANNELQMIQFIPVVITPQVFFSGMFDLPPWMDMFGRFMPLYYVGDALTEVMIKGSGVGAIAADIAVMLCCSLFFMILNTMLLKKYRNI